MYSESLPISGFEWCNEKKIENLNVNEMKDDNNFSYILEVDFKNPEELHKLHQDFPLASGKKTFQSYD